MKKLFTIVLLQVLCVAGLKAQFQDIESKYVTQLKGKILLVALQEETTRTLLDLKRTPDELQKYKDGIASFNQMLTDVATKYWKYGKGVEALPQSKVNKLIEDGNTKYVVLQFALREGNIKPIMFRDIYGSGEYTTATRELSKKEGYGAFHLQLSIGKKAETIYSVFLPVAYPSQSDMKFAVQLMSNQFNKMLKEKEYKVDEFRAEITKNNKQLAKKTLLIDKTQMGSKTTLDELQKAYPHKIEYTDYEVINKALMTDDPAYAYVMVIPGEAPSNKITQSKVSVMLQHLVMDAEDGDVLARVKPTRMNYDKVADDISKKEIKEYVEK